MGIRRNYVPRGYRLVIVSKIRHRNGRVIYPKRAKAFRFLVPLGQLRRRA